MNWHVCHGKWFNNAKLFLIQPFLIAKFDYTKVRIMELAVKSGNGPTALLPTWLRTLQLLRLLRIIKLFRHCT